MKKLLIILLLGFSACSDKETPLRNLLIVVTYETNDIDTIPALGIDRLWLNDYNTLGSGNSNLRIRDVKSYRIISDTLVLKN